MQLDLLPRFTEVDVKDIYVIRVAVIGAISAVVGQRLSDVCRCVSPLAWLSLSHATLADSVRRRWSEADTYARCACTVRRMRLSRLLLLLARHAVYCYHTVTGHSVKRRHNKFRPIE
jgi:hypothetical protein